MTMPKSYTVPSGVAAANFLRSGLASRLPTPKIYEYDRTLDNVPRTVHLDEICRGDEVLRRLVWLGGSGKLSSLKDKSCDMGEVLGTSSTPLDEEQRSCAVVRWRLPLGWVKAAA